MGEGEAGGGEGWGQEGRERNWNPSLFPQVPMETSGNK